jgi:hypothetical protein
VFATLATELSDRGDTKRDSAAERSSRSGGSADMTLRDRAICVGMAGALLAPWQPGPEIIPRWQLAEPDPGG